MSERTAKEVVEEMFRRQQAGDDAALDLVAIDMVNHAAGPQGRDGLERILRNIDDAAWAGARHRGRTVNRMADIGGHPTWVDDRGAGEETVVLLHGGMSHSGLLLDAFGDALTDRYRVVSFDRRGCGRTPDPGGPFHYADMATDTIGVLESVVGGPAHLVGWSDGGIIALLVALRRPDLIRRLVIIGTNVHHDAALPVDVDPHGPFFSRIRDDYAALSPDGADHLENISERFGLMVTTEPTMTPADLVAITAPTLVMAGDDDFFGLDHTCAIYAALPAGRLAIVPGASHALPLEHPALMTSLLLAFLASAEPPPTLLAVRRAE